MPKSIDLTGQRFGKLIVKEKASNYKGRTAWLCQCDCGQEKIVTTKNLRNGTTKSCGCLKHKDLTGLKFGKLTVIRATTERKHNSVVWECLCDCGNITYATTQGLQVGDNTSCGCFNKAKNKFANTYKIDLTNKHFGKLTVLGATDMRSSSGNQIWKCLCECGNICYVSTNHLQTNNTQSCGCLQGHSIGELQIKELLDKANIKYKQEYIFSDMPNRRYDFAIFNNNGEIIQLIEFDGEQHFIETPFFKTTLKEQQDIDAEKNEYAKNHNIKLIRIPYWKRNKLKLEDIIDELPQ